MRTHLRIRVVGLFFGSAAFLSGVAPHAQTNDPTIVLKNGESTDLQSFYWVVNCASIVVGIPEIEVIDGPAELSLALKPGMVLPRRQNCAKPVQGGTVVATAKDVKEPTRRKLTYRIKYKTKVGDRQEGHVYNVSLFP